MVSSIVAWVKTVIEAAGIWKVLVRCLSMDLACWTEKVLCWAAAVMVRIPAAHIGPIRIRDFSSSTRWTVQSFHGLGDLGSSSSVTIAALSRHLHVHVLMK